MIKPAASSGSAPMTPERESDVRMRDEPRLGQKRARDPSLDAELEREEVEARGDPGASSSDAHTVLINLLESFVVDKEAFCRKA